MSIHRGIAGLFLGLVLVCCAPDPGTSSRGPSSGPPPASAQSGQPRTVKIDQATAQRLQTIMTPLLQHMDHPLPLNQVKMAVMEDDHINAANAGGGQFLVTTGLLRKASDDQIRGVMAHEVAHEDLGHVAKTQTVGAVTDIGWGLLESIFPSIGGLNLGPVASQLIVSHYSRGEETEADAHGVDILKRAGFNGKSVMGDTLTWIAQTEGTSGGGFFDTHPATNDRIAAVQRLP